MHFCLLFFLCLFSSYFYLYSLLSLSHPSLFSSVFVIFVSSLLYLAFIFICFSFSILSFQSSSSNSLFYFFYIYALFYLCFFSFLSIFLLSINLPTFNLGNMPHSLSVCLPVSLLTPSTSYGHKSQGWQASIFSLAMGDTSTLLTKWWQNEE